MVAGTKHATGISSSLLGLLSSAKEMLYALVDFHNEAISRGTRLGNAQDYLDVLEAVVADLTRSQKVVAVGTDEIVVRLYGGWYDETTRQPTLDHELAANACGRLARRWRRYRVRSSCATGPLADSNIVFRSTLRTRTRAPNLRNIYHSTVCGQVSDCALPDLACWINGRCPHFNTCNVRRDHVLGWFGQKMVDAMLSADMFHICLYERLPAVVVANDDDYVPSILTAKLNGLPVWILYSNRQTEPEFLNYLLSIEAAELLQ